MKKILIKILIISVAICTLLTSNIFVLAHETLLDVGYDDCQLSYDEDWDLVDEGTYEIWYYLYSPINDSSIGSRINLYIHISEDVKTVKYYFADNKPLSSYTWTTEVSQEIANEIKTAYANSMKKWNDVVYYSYDSNGNRIENKIVNIVEGTKDDHDIVIYPVDYRKTF